MATILISCDFSHAGAVHALLGQFDAQVLAQRYHAEGLHIEVRVPRERLRALEHALRDVTRGQASVGSPGDDV
jgi:putative IMPACT (imprinted ancient) family translation regulator